MALNINVLDADQWACRLLSLFPAKWSSPEARQPGGVLYALFKALGLQLNITNENIVYTWFATRIATAQDAALDTCARDFFGAAFGMPQMVIRAAGESDTAFRQRILANMMMPGSTRIAMLQMITNFAGSAPRIIEPWRVQDTAAWDASSYWDVDLQVTPARFGDPSPARNNEAAVITQLPTIPGAAPFPFFAFDAGSGWDASYFLDSNDGNTWLLNAARMDALINQTKVFGTKVYRNYDPALTQGAAIATSYSLQPGVLQRAVAVYPPFAGSYAVIAIPNWPASVNYESTSSAGFTFNFNVGSPQGAAVDWIAAPLTVPGFNRIPVQANATQINLTAPTAQFNPFISPSWNTAYWVSASSNGVFTIQFSTPAPVGSTISYCWLPMPQSGHVLVEAGTQQTTIPVPAGTSRYLALVNPGWDTQWQIQKYSTHFDLTFASPPDQEYPFYWAVYPY